MPLEWLLLGQPGGDAAVTEVEIVEAERAVDETAEVPEELARKQLLDGLARGFGEQERGENLDPDRAFARETRGGTERGAQRDLRHGRFRFGHGPAATRRGIGASRRDERREFGAKGGRGRLVERVERDYGLGEGADDIALNAARKAYTPRIDSQPGDPDWPGSTTFGSLSIGKKLGLARLAAHIARVVRYDAANPSDQGEPASP